MKIVKIVAVLFAVLVLGLAAFLGWRVADARARTPQLVAEWVAQADPDVKALPKARIDQYLAVEDPTFWTNDGVDLKTPGAGQTTTTQGLGKLIYFKHFRGGYWNKLQLILVSRHALTAKASKQDILTAALTAANMGSMGDRPVIGLADAARTYFGKPLSALSDDQYLALVAMPVGPDRYNPSTHPAQNADRVARIKRLLAHVCTPTGLNDVMLEGCKPV
jgi:monofunctional biosynthetic peptidoglycan transglycosylase